MTLLPLTTGLAGILPACSKLRDTRKPIPA